MSVFSDLFGWIGKLFTKIWHAFKIALPYILLACALWVAFVGPLALAWLGLSMTIPAGWASALFFMGTSYLVAPEETTAVVSNVATAVGDSAQVVVKEAGEVGVAVGDALGSAISSFLSSSGLVWVALAIGGYLLLSGDSDDTETADKSTAKSDDAVAATPRAKISTRSANEGSYRKNTGERNNAISDKQIIVGKYSDGVGLMANRTVTGRG